MEGRGRATATGRRALLACALWVLLGAALPASADAALTIESLNLTRSTTQAGDDPDLGASFALDTDEGAEAAETATLGLPEGFFLDPTAVPRCAAATFADFECANASQAGLIVVRAELGGEPDYLLGTAPLYALEPGPDETAAFGFVAPVIKVPVRVQARVRTESDFGFDLIVGDLPADVPLTGLSLELWGVPAAAQHDTSRFNPGTPGNPAGCPLLEPGPGCTSSLNPPGIVPVALLRAPTACPGDDLFLLDVTTHEHPAGHLLEDASAAVTTGCSHNRFGPETEVALTTTAANAPTGLDLDVEQPRTFSPDAISQSAIQSLELLLPPGFELRSEALGALSNCEEAEFEPESPTPPACPADSKVASISLEIEGFEAPLAGEAYLGEPEPDVSLPLYVTASGAGIHAKLFGLLDTEPGGEPVVLVELPQAPIWHLALSFEGGEALFETPGRCGAYEFIASATSWGEPFAPTDTSDSVALDSHCSAAPVEDGTAVPQAGSADGNLSKPSAPATAKPATRRQPRVRITHHPHRRTHDRTPTFRFAANRRGVRFVCKVDRGRFRRCASPLTLRKLRPGRHVLKVRAVESHGRRSRPARWRFRLLSRHR